MSQTVRVLLVDSCVPTRIGLCEIFKKVARLKIVGEAGKAATALKLIEQKQPDLILLDSRLPDLHGRELIAEIQERGLARRILVFGSSEDEDEVRAMLEQGAAGYVLKDEPPEKIVEAVRAVAAGGQWLSQKIAARLAKARNQPHAASEDLTERELEIVELLAQGLTNQEIAEELKIAPRTVRYHVANIFLKLGLTSRGRVMAWAQRNERVRERLKEVAKRKGRRK